MQARVFATVLAMVSACGCYRAFAADPATQPPATTDSSGEAIDVFRSFLLDIQSGNAADIASICSARDAQARGLMEDFQAVASAMAYLRSKATEKFGASAAEAVLPALPSLTDLDDATEKFDGDTAEVSGGAIWPVRLIRTRGVWKLDLDWLERSDDMPANPHWFGEMARAIRRTGDDIASGRLATAQSAATAMQAREQGIPDERATLDSAPSTEPSTRP